MPAMSDGNRATDCAWKSNHDASQGQSGRQLARYERRYGRDEIGGATFQRCPHPMNREDVQPFSRLVAETDPYRVGIAKSK